jgi:hypothetical protein
MRPRIRLEEALEKAKTLGWSRLVDRVIDQEDETRMSAWEGIGSVAISLATWCDAVDGSLQGKHSDESPWQEPFVSACGDGSVHISWYFCETRQEIRFETRDGRYLWTTFVEDQERGGGEASSAEDLGRAIRNARI